MSVVHKARRVITRAADATTATAGALGGAAVTGAIGAVEGTAAGIKNGLSSGSHSTAAAALTLGAVGVAGLGRLAHPGGCRRWRAADPRTQSPVSDQYTGCSDG